MAESQSTVVAPAVEYRDIEGFPGYRVGSDGSVWSCLLLVKARGPGSRGKSTLVLTGAWRRLKTSQTGSRWPRPTVSLYRGGKKFTYRVQHLVTSAFLGPRPAGLETCHNDGDRFNNALGNLRYDTKESNEADKDRHGARAKGERSGSAKLTEDDVRDIRRRLADRETLASIASRYGVDFTLISCIKRRKVWAWLT